MQETANSTDAPARLSARLNSSCFVCGMENSRGLRLHFEQNNDGAMSAEWTPDPAFEGFEGIVHGGIVSTVLDESMAKAVAATGVEALTAELRVRFRRHVAAGDPMRVHGWVKDRNKRIIQAEATLVDRQGTELAHAWSSFLALK